MAGAAKFAPEQARLGPRSLVIFPTRARARTQQRNATQRRRPAARVQICEPTRAPWWRRRRRRRVSSPAPGGGLRPGAATVPRCIGGLVQTLAVRSIARPVCTCERAAAHPLTQGGWFLPPPPPSGPRDHWTSRDHCMDQPGPAAICDRQPILANISQY